MPSPGVDEGVDASSDLVLECYVKSEVSIVYLMALQCSAASKQLLPVTSLAAV